MVRVFLLDDHEIVRQWLAGLLSLGAAIVEAAVFAARVGEHRRIYEG